MALYLNRKFLVAFFSLTFELIIFLFSSSFTVKENFLIDTGSKQIKNLLLTESQPQLSFNSKDLKNSFISCNSNENYSVTCLQNNVSVQFNKSNYRSTDLNFAYPYFHLIYTGIGVDHMNINLVNLASTGLIVGDEIGVFDDIYCVGSAVIEEKNINENSISIPASANEKIEPKPNGYIEGNKITLKTYRSGTVYLLYFQTVNNSTNIFERGGSMFALVDFSRSEKQSIPEGTEETKIYPNPFDALLRIEVNLSEAQQLDCEIFDIAGKLVKTLFKGISEGQQLLVWDGKDDRKNQVIPGIYFCRVNNSTTKIIYRK